jgi:hypothetical protein
MSQDIKSFEPRILGPFTLRQIICVSLSCSYGIPLVLALPGDISVRILVALVLMTPVVACGWLRVQGMPLEKFAVMIFKNMIKKPKRRYGEENELYNCLPAKKKVIYKETKTSKKIKGYK